MMEFATDPSTAVPHLDVTSDTGNFVYAVYQMPAGNAYMAEGTTCTWPQWISAWSKVVGVPARYKQVTPDEMIQATEDVDVGIEVTHMFRYMSDPGYDGGMKLLKASDIATVSTSREKFKVRLANAINARRALSVR